MSGKSQDMNEGDEPVLTDRGLAFISKDRPVRINAIAEYLSTADYDIVCLQELWIYKDYEHVRDIVSHNLPCSRFFHT
jgi:sphingomyelin phosphodiesterase 2